MLILNMALNFTFVCIQNNIVQQLKQSLYSCFHLQYSFNFILFKNYFLQVILDNINFVKIKIWNPNTKSETQN
jgi:hypothetical protein